MYLKVDIKKDQQVIKRQGPYFNCCDLSFLGQEKLFLHFLENHKGIVTASEVFDFFVKNFVPTRTRWEKLGRWLFFRKRTLALNYVPVKHRNIRILFNQPPQGILPPLSLPGTDK